MLDLSAELVTEREYSIEFAKIAEESLAREDIKDAEITRLTAQVASLKREVNADYLAYCEAEGPCDDEYCDCRNPRDLPYPEVEDTPTC